MENQVRSLKNSLEGLAKQIKVARKAILDNGGAESNENVESLTMITPAVVRISNGIKGLPSNIYNPNVVVDIDYAGESYNPLPIDFLRKNSEENTYIIFY
jgi:hypothetical protein